MACSTMRPRPTAVWLSLLKELASAGVKCDDEVQAADRFDPKYLSKIVD
jgi:hypothetical protein